jgi:ubiquilin
MFAAAANSNQGGVAGTGTWAAASPWANLFAARQPIGDPHLVYREQLNTLITMGFTDPEANVRALVATGGNIELAVERLLNEQ